MKHFFSKLNAKTRQEFWLGLDPEDRAGILELAEKDEKAKLFLENIRMSETIDPDDAWVVEGLQYCEDKNGLKPGKTKNIVESLMKKREELREKVSQFGNIGLDVVDPVLGKVQDVLKNNNVDLGFDLSGIISAIKNNLKKED